MNNVNDKLIKIKNIKKKKFLIISTEEEYKMSFLNNLIEYNHLVKKRIFEDHEEVLIEYEYQNGKYFQLTIGTYTNYDINHINIKESDGIIFIYSKHSQDGLKYIRSFIKNYHKLIGNKFFPSVYVQNETVYHDTDISYILPYSDINWLTFNGSFPLIKVSNDFDRKETNKIINTLIVEIRKEKNDEFPYFLAYDQQLKINFCIKNKKLFKYINMFLFLLIMVFTILDTLFILNTRDFLNEKRKIDEIFLGIRLNMNAINFISGLIFMKFILCDKEKYKNIVKIEQYSIGVNFISYLIQIFLHFRIQHLLTHNEAYYSIRMHQMFVFMLFIISFIIMKYLSISLPQKRKD